MVSWRDIAADSDNEGEDFHSFSDMEVQELDSDSVSESGSEISSDSIHLIPKWLRAHENEAIGARHSEISIVLYYPEGGFFKIQLFFFQ